MLTVGDLFSGIGGFSLGLERAGMREAARIAEEAQSSAFPVAAHVAIRAAAGEGEA